MPTDDPDADLRALFVDLVSDPTAENYRRAWDVATALPDYNPYGSELSKIEQLLGSGNFQAAREATYDAMGGWLLNPRIHLMAGFAASKLGDDRTARMESMFAGALIRAIQSTGDASVERPYLVTCTADEYDLVDALQKKPGVQALLKVDGKVIDRIDCEDGPTLHFDITRPYNRLAEQMVAGEKPDA